MLCTRRPPAACPRLQRAATCSECPAPVSEEERRRLLAELQEYEREELRVQNEQRTRQFVDSMWQSLE